MVSDDTPGCASAVFKEQREASRPGKLTSPDDVKDITNFKVIERTIPDIMPTQAETTQKIQRQVLSK
jgi:hypothetical protein